jgi:hypothetical protein
MTYSLTNPVTDSNPLPVTGSIAVTGGATSAKQDTTNTLLGVLANGTEYEAVAASQTDQILGATGAIGDYLSHLIIQPGTTSPGNVILKDGSTTIYTFPGGASSVATLDPITLPLGVYCTGAGWKVTTGANVTVVGAGNFT